nr:radical SAM protein [uncultured Desulfobulbus sp.]
MGRMRQRLGTMGRLLAGQAPGQLIIQLTDRCNARCPQCGMRVLNRFPRTRLDNDYVRRLLDAGAARGMRMVSFTGGEPMLLRDDLIELIDYAGKVGFQYIRTGTNGFLFRNHQDPRFSDRVNALAERLSATPLRNLWFSVDSAEPEMHDTMRGFPGVLQGIAKALPIFHAHGLYPSANVGLNRNLTHETMQLKPLADGGDGEQFAETFGDGLARLYTLLLDMGFTLTSACYPMSVEPDDSGLQAVYGATAAEQLVRFDQREKVLLYQALTENVRKFRAQLRIVTPLSSLQSLIMQHSGRDGAEYGCRGGIDYLFVDSVDGQTYPCGYRGAEPMGRLWELDENRRKANCKGMCRRCDWECFRDPSELFGPVLRGLSRPWQLVDELRRDPQFFRLWREDLSYARACDLYDGRKAPDFARLQSFACAQSVGKPSFASPVFAANAVRVAERVE